MCFLSLIGVLSRVVTRKCSYRPRNPEIFRDSKSDSIPKVTQMLLKSDAKITKTVENHILLLLSDFEITLSHFQIGRSPKTHFLVTFFVFEFFGALGSVGPLPGHNSRGSSQYTQKSREGSVRKGGFAQICRNLPAKFAQNCRYFGSYIRGRVRKNVANLSRI